MGEILLKIISPPNYFLLISLEMKKISIIYLILLLIVIIFFAYVLLIHNRIDQNNDNLTNLEVNSFENIYTNWKIYTDQNNNFNINYPKDWFIQNSLGDLTIADTNEEVYYSEPFNTNARYADWAGVIFKFHDLEEDFSWNNFLSRYIEIEKWSSIDGWSNAVEITELSGIFSGDPHYFIKTDNQVIEIYGLNVYYEEYQEKQIILEKIINSLKIFK